jgi:hypothetical protein
MMTQIREAISNLNPNEVRQLADKPVSLELFALAPQAYQTMERFFIPSTASADRRAEFRQVIYRAGEAPNADAIKIYYVGMLPSKGGFVFDPNDPNRVVREILEAHPELNLSLARHVAPFREPVVKDIIRSISKENALFSLATALPAVVPFISLPWAIGEFASDTAFLTMNQMRMAFQLAAASDRPIGYKEQRSEIASLFAGAFGWRALARELVGHIPLGGGLIPKAAVAYAGTFVVGASIERYYRLGYGYTRKERKETYESALERGKSIVGSFLETYKARQQAS